MLDRATLHALAQHPERNDAALNVALAEEGDFAVLKALSESVGAGADALTVVAARVAAEGERVGYEELDNDDGVRRGARREAEEITGGTDLDARLILHPYASASVRDAVLARHLRDPYFVIAAAAHPLATPAALDGAARWPAETQPHDRPWLQRILRAPVDPPHVEGWSTSSDSLLREAAACVTSDLGCLARLAADPSRRVRRAVASRRDAASAPLRQQLAERDPACEVRARAAGADPPPARGAIAGAAFPSFTPPPDADEIAAMAAGGILAADVARAMRRGPLDVEGARLASQALDESSVGAIIATSPLGDEVGVALASGVALRALRPPASSSADSGLADEEVLLGRCVRVLAGADRSGGIVTGKHRLAAWLADGLTAMARADEHALRSGPVLDDFVEALGRPSLAADRMVLGRVASARGCAGIVAALAAGAAASPGPIPVALLELAWRQPAISDDTVARLAARVAPAEKPSSSSASDAAPENDVDLDPRARPLEVLESVGAALAARAPLSPRAALTLVALGPRRIRYVLSALPQWRGVLSGAHVARVLKAHAGALSAAGPSGARPKREGGSASWTQRRLDEAELAVALAIGDLSPSDVATRIASGHDLVEGGVALAAAMEAAAALQGVTALEPLVELLSNARRKDAALLAAWLVVEPLDRPRTAAGLAAALDAPWAVAARSSTRAGLAAAPNRAVVAPGLSEALATLERRAPGRLAEAIPQTPRGRAALVSGLARAYRALGGMSVTEGREG